MTDTVLHETLRRSLEPAASECTICETACPVSNVSPLFPGPKYAGPQSERYRVASDPSVDASVDKLFLGLFGIC